MVELPKPRAPRIERHAPPDPFADSEESLGWAVSYADVLMVLLSFFVIFFSIRRDQPDSPLRSILKLSALASKLTPAESANSSAKTNNSAQVNQPEGLLRAITVLNLPTQIKKMVEPEEITLLLPENIFDSGSTTLNATGSALIDETLSSLTPFKDKINLTFIGFSDPRNLSRGKGAVIQNNFDLSALRATRALSMANAKGFPSEQLQAKGSSHYGRESRTISLVITPRTTP